MVTVKRKGKTYKLNKEEFIKYMLSLEKRAKAIKQAKIDMEKEKEEEK